MQSKHKNKQWRLKPKNQKKQFWFREAAVILLEISRVMSGLGGRVEGGPYSGLAKTTAALMQERAAEKAQEDAAAAAAAAAASAPPMITYANTVAKSLNRQRAAAAKEAAAARARADAERARLMAKRYAAPSMEDLPKLSDTELNNLLTASQAREDPYAWLIAEEIKKRVAARDAGAPVVGSGAGWNAFLGAGANNSHRFATVGLDAFRRAAAGHEADLAAAPPSPFAAPAASGGGASGGAASGGAGAPPRAFGDGRYNNNLGGGYRKSKSRSRSKSRKSQKKSRKSQKKSRKSQKKSRSRR